MQYQINTNSFYQDLSNSIRILSADAVEKANSGHPGLPLGFADVFTVLATKFMKYCPQDPKWKGRDRFVLSAGHGSMLLYSFFHLAGFKGYDLNQIENFRQLGSLTPGHPEYEPDSPIETTTGPLGQGFANAVGMAIAQKKYAQKLGKIADYKIYCAVGDGCLMEGISSEAASLAGHLKLNNLIVLFDDNRISIDGPTDLTTSDDHIAKFKSLGFQTYSADGHNYEEIEAILAKCQNSELPCFVAFRTKIGFGAGKKEGSEQAHGAALGTESISILRKNLNWDDRPFYIPAEILEKWESAWEFNRKDYESWKEEYSKLSSLDKLYLGELDRQKIKEAIDATSNNSDSEATRVSMGKVVETILKSSEKVIVGSADLSISNGLYNGHCKPITKDDFSGNFIHFGVRENAMAAIMNGLATQGFLPFGGTFLVFSDYMRPGIRLSAIMNLPCIYVMTHDSIGVGEDGPTHQPVEHLASLRAIPNLKVFRPCDMQEVRACMEVALSNNSPSLFALTRQKVPHISRAEACIGNIDKGAYILESDQVNVDISIWATGSEVSIAQKVKQLLNKAGYRVRLISAPCIELFFEQDEAYKNKLLEGARFTVAIEAASKFGWERIIGRNGMFFGVNSFGISAPAEDIYNHFGLIPESIANKIIEGTDGKDWN